MDKRTQTATFEAGMGAGRVPLAQPRAARSKKKAPIHGADGVGEKYLRPALFARYKTLSNLRHDYPLLLVEGAADSAFVRPLSSLIDGVLQEIAPRGVAGERLRKQALRLEREIRALVSRGARGSLSRLWERALANLISAASGEAGASLGETASLARARLRVDGELIDCGKQTPVAVLMHAWDAVRRAKTLAFRDRADALICKLKDILKADLLRSREGQSAANLKRAFGGAFASAFDFDAMAGLLARGGPENSLPEGRRKRIRDTLSILQSQRFFLPAANGSGPPRCEGAHTLVVESCMAAMDAYRQRLPEMAALIKALAIAELETANRYKEPKHDPFFSRFDGTSLSDEDLALFPPILVCLRADHCAGAEQAKIVAILSSGLPIKILLQTDDVPAETGIRNGTSFPDADGYRLARMAVGLGGAFVLQAASSYLCRQSDLVWKGFAYRGPALFSIFSGTGASRSDDREHGHEPYLTAAAAVESRAFPVFSYDPAAGPDWSSRFRIGENPQAERDWPIHRLSYEDENLQAASEDIAFTFVDFLVGDGRHGTRFALVPRLEWNDAMIPVAKYLESERSAARGTMPYILVVDNRDVLHRAVVDGELVSAARRCRETWRSLQELGGVNNCHAKKLLESERQRWEQEKQKEIEALKARLEEEGKAPAMATEPATPGAAPLQPAAAPEAAPASAQSRDESYIETPRCTTCEECIRINNKMFAYDDNKQAYIADLSAGTYRQLVEAAEACQVAIIHPGKPKNPNEPELDGLIKRAAAFA